MPSSRLDRFKDAQALPGSGFEAALTELRAGGKRGHWIWYIFPQLVGLGSSSNSRVFGLAGVQEAEAYLRDPVLRGRLLTAASAVADRVGQGDPLPRLMGSSIDVRKLVSSLTLFGNIAKRLQASEHVADCAAIAEAADTVLAAAAVQGYPPCALTLQRLRKS